MTLSGASDNTPARLRALTPRERARLASILARLASPYEGERAAAGLLASAFIAKHNLAWTDLPTFLQPVPEASVASDELLLKQDRRGRASKTWRGYCRRRLVLIGQALNRFT